MKLAQSALYSSIVTIFGSSVYCLFGLAQVMLQKGSFSQFVGDWFVSTIACFALFTFIFYELGKMFDELNKPRREVIIGDEPSGLVAVSAPVKMKLEVLPDEDMTVVVVYTAKDGSFKNREIFSQEVEKGKRYKWEVEIPQVSGTATVYLVTGDGGSWAGEKDYEF
ncbi:MAG: hypothetical protein K2X77_23190 [Candidatus Obscuribacterales bacterium]|nr:hypothetical protein [Candidatus Obscuribacterales bacterium]